MARLLVSALLQGGHDVELASELRSLERAGDVVAQEEIRSKAEDESNRLIAAYRERPAGLRPELWFTYHVYYKAPDWLGPAVSAALDIPYVTAEASYALKRARGAWATGHEQTCKALMAGDLHFCLTAFDRVALEEFLGGGDKLIDLPPFLEAVPDANGDVRARRRAAICDEAGFEPAVPIVVVVAMMRPGDKETSYTMLAAALAGLTDIDWNLVIVGDGGARSTVEAAFAAIPTERLHWTGAVEPETVGHYLAGADLYAWPAHNEAYGMAFLEAQAWGLPVVAQSTRGVPDVVAAGRSGILTPEGDVDAFRAALAEMIGNRDKRAAMGEAARAFIVAERTIERASVALDLGLRSLAR